MKRIVRLVLPLLGVLAFTFRLSAAFTLQGPIYPPLGGVGFTQTGTNAGRTGGVTWFFSNTVQAASNIVYWGVSNNGVAMSFYESTFSSAEIMTFDPAASSPANGLLVWNGTTHFPSSGPTIYTRFVLTLSDYTGTLPLSSSNTASLDLPAAVGGVVWVPTNLAWQANLQLLASTNGPGGPFTPGLNLFDTYHGNPYNYGGEDFSSIQAGFYFDTPPQLAANNTLTAGLDTTNVITSSYLQATDVESDPTSIIFTIDPSGGPPFAGFLQINGTNLVSGSTFSQADINAGRLIYIQNGTCSPNDGFTFNVNDSDRGVASDDGFTVFDFNINIDESNLPPVANNQSFNVGLGASYSGFLTASNPNCVTVPFTYSVLTPPTNGTLVVTNSTGGFNYTATAGHSGVDSFSFQVNDTTTNSLTPGIVSVTISVEAPIAIPGSGTTTENVAYSGEFQATDPNNPPQPLTYSVTGGGVGQLGTAVVTNASTGGFLYTPNPGAFGVDTINFQAYNGSLYSPAGTFLVSIRPTLDPGHALVADQNSDSVVEIDPVNGYYFQVSVSNLLTHPAAIALEARGTVLVSDSSNGLVRIDPSTGNQTLLSGNTNFSGPLGTASGLAIRADGSILAADLTGQIELVDPVSGVASSYSSGGALAVPFALVISRDGKIYASDATALTNGSSHLDVINPVTTIATTQAVSGTLPFPTAITMDFSNLYVADTDPFGGVPPAIYLINPANGAQSLITEYGDLSFATGMAVTTNHLLLVALNSGPGTTNLVLVNPSSGTQSYLSGPVRSAVLNPWGVTVVPSLPPPPVITHTSQPGPGQFAIQFTGNTNATYSVLSATNITLPIVDWTYLGTPGLLSNNVFQFTDLQATNSIEFYLLRSP